MAQIVVTAQDSQPLSFQQNWRKWQARFHWIAPLVLYTSITLVVTYPLVLHLNTSILGKAAEGDSMWQVWWLWWFRKALELGQDPAYTNYMFALLPSVKIFPFAYFEAGVGWLLQWVMSPLASYTILVLLAFILSGLMMYLLAGEFVPNRLACFMAGFLYTFSTPHIQRAFGHLNLATIEWLPFLAWRLFVFFRQPNSRNAILMGIGITLVPFSDIYYLAYFALPFISLFLLGKLISNHAWFVNRRHLLLCSLALVLALVIAGPLLAGYLQVDRDVQDSLQSTAQTGLETLSANLVAYGLPYPDNPVFGKSTAIIYTHMKTPFLIEEAVYLGYVTMLLAVSTFLFRRNRTRITLFWLIFGVSGFILSLGPKLFVAEHVLSPLPAYKLVYGWPLLSNFRAPNRLVVVPLLAATLLASFALDSIFSFLTTKHLPKPILVGLAMIILVTSLTEHIQWSFPLPSAPVPTPALYSQIASDQDDNLLLDLPLLPIGSYQYYQTIHHKRLVNGLVIRFTPAMFTSVQNVPFLPLFDEFSAPLLAGKPEALEGDIFPLAVNFKTGLQENKIKYVILHRKFDTSTYAWMRAFLLDNLATPFYNNAVEGLTAWRVEPGAAPNPNVYSFKLGKGWVQGLGIQDHHLERGVQQDGQLLIMAPRTEQQLLNFKATSIFKPLTMEVRLNGVVVKRIAFIHPGIAQLVDLGAVNLKQGQNSMEIHAVEGCTRPMDVTLNNSDSRCFSFGVQQIRLTSPLLSRARLKS